MAVHICPFPACCGARIMSNFWNINQTHPDGVLAVLTDEQKSRLGWENKEELDGWVKRLTGSPFICAILSYAEWHSFPETEEVLRENGFALVGEEPNYSGKEEPLKFFLYERSKAKRRGEEYVKERQSATKKGKKAA